MLYWQKFPREVQEEQGDEWKTFLFLDKSIRNFNNQ